MLHDSKIIAILRGVTPSDVVEHVGCLVDHGITDIEIPTNSPDWPTTIQKIRGKFSDLINLGVGTVLTTDSVIKSAQLAANFILTPNLNPEIISTAKEKGLCVCAGVFTSSEIFMAFELKVDILKVFPAGALPINYPQMIKGPLSQKVYFSAVGGVTIENAYQYLRYYDSVGIGSSLYRPGQDVATTAENCIKLIRSGE